MIFALLVAGAYALATLRRYSVAQTATLTTFALFLSSGLTTISGAPTFDIYTKMQHEPWNQACGPVVATTPRHPSERHSVHRTMKHVHTQFKVAKRHFHNELKNVQEIYSNVTKQLKEQYSLPWLPEKQYEWYHKEVWCLDKAKKAEVVLPRLHDTLQRFAITFYRLKSFNLESHLNTGAWAKRNKIIDGMYHEIRGMLCEVDTAIETMGIPMPPSHKITVVTESPNWTDKADFTRMLVQDSGILRMYRIYLEDWVKALRQATAKGTGICDPSKKPPLNSHQNKRKKPGQNRNGGKKRVRGQKQAQGKRPSVSAKKMNVGQGERNNIRRKLNGNKQRPIL